MFRLTILAALGVLCIAGPVARGESINAGNRTPSADQPFKIAAVAAFDTPWAIAFLPDARMLVTEKPGRMFLVTQSGTKTAIGGVPKVEAVRQNGLLDVAVAPDFATSSQIYFTYVAPGAGGSRLTLGEDTSRDPVRRYPYIGRQLLDTAGFGERAARRE